VIETTDDDGNTVFNFVEISARPFARETAT
jgi:hypothetical protein